MSQRSSGRSVLIEQAQTIPRNCSITGSYVPEVPGNGGVGHVTQEKQDAAAAMQRAVEVTRQATASVAATVDELRDLQARLLSQSPRRPRWINLPLVHCTSCCLPDLHHVDVS